MSDDEYQDDSKNAGDIYKMFNEYCSKKFELNSTEKFFLYTSQEESWKTIFTQNFGPNSAEYDIFTESKESLKEFFIYLLLSENGKSKLREEFARNYNPFPVSVLTSRMVDLEISDIDRLKGFRSEPDVNKISSYSDVD